MCDLDRFSKIQSHIVELMSMPTSYLMMGPKDHLSQFESVVLNLHTISGQLIPLTILIVPTIAVPIPNGMAQLSH